VARRRAELALIRPLWKGALWDAELGLYQMRYCWYEPAMGRFLTRDPLGIWGDPLNLSHATNFAGHDPINWNDPYGLRGWAASCAARLRDWSG
jgi:RHS repeat-associated protein